MKTAVSIPDDVFEDAERLANRLKVSRSRLYADAVRDYVKRRDPDAITAAMNRALDAATADPESLDADRRFVSAAAARTLTQVEW
jgi:metal-responsive CopG/Arc/MetJ family transcriptional regulator